ncbi:MAG: type 4a pilus biogenesis protein PilO [Deltaproteobacteria bacterium]|nr:type 4a pilus biogenesis protein PilO [Deltaproteobacteria bacterium]MCL6119936.1 type 4a pilus biogenesis protein PilO [Deltaproteobacteria bacterium]
MKLLDDIKKIPAYLRNNKIILVLLMAFIFIYLINQDIFINIIYKNIENKNAQIVKIKKKMEFFKKTAGTLFEEKNTLYRLKKQIKNLNLKLKNDESILPKTAKISSLIKNISADAPSANFIIEKINFGNTINYQDIKALPIQIYMSGGFNKTLIFIKNIYEMNRVFVINYVSIKPSVKSFPDVKTVVKGFVFYG